MTSFITKRLLWAIPTLLAIAVFTFFAARLAPGGPFSADKNAPPEVIASLNKHYGLDRPMLVQFVSYLGNALTGNLGPSFKYPNRSVNELIASAAPVSFELGIWALVIALLFGLPAGMIAALHHNKVADFSVMSVAMVGVCVPTFVIGPLLVLLFALTWQVLPVAGWMSWQDRILPAITLGLPYGAYIARLTRGGLLDIYTQDFIVAARARGVSENGILVKHALKGGLIPVVSFLGPACAGLVTGSFVVETIFSVPGLGRFFIMAAFNRDYTMIMGTVLFYATLIIILNMIADIAVAWLNPRVTLE